MPAAGARHFFQDFFRTEAASGLVLLAAALVAMAAANSSWAPAYEAFWHTRLVVGPEAHPLSLTAQQWVNDGLMAVFFLLVGLEIKRELLVGELSTRRQAALPFAAALGGVVGPGLLYLALAPAEARARAGRFRWPPTSPSPWACWRWWRPARRPGSRCSSPRWPSSTTWPRCW